MLDQPMVSWRSDNLDWSKLTDTGFTFNIPDNTTTDEDNQRAAILSVTREGDSVDVETTRGNFTFDQDSLKQIVVTHTF